MVARVAWVAWVAWVVCIFLDMGVMASEEYYHCRALSLSLSICLRYNVFKLYILIRELNYTIASELVVQHLYKLIFVL